jgi:hypothetical protein
MEAPVPCPYCGQTRISALTTARTFEQVEPVKPVGGTSVLGLLPHFTAAALMWATVWAAPTETWSAAALSASIGLSAPLIVAMLATVAICGSISVAMIGWYCRLQRPRYWDRLAPLLDAPTVPRTRRTDRQHAA